MDTNAPDLIRQIHFPIDCYDNIGKVYEAYVKNLALAAIEKGGFDTRAYFDETFQCSLKILRENMDKFGRVFSTGSGRLLVIDEKFLLQSEVMRDEGPIRFRIWILSAKDSITPIITKAKEIFKPFIYNKMGIDITWAFVQKGDIDYIDLQSELDEIIYREAYPYIANLDEWINKYLDNRAPILILIGSPGTGKTRLIKYILKTIGERKSSIYDLNTVEEYGNGELKTKTIKNPYVLYSMEDKVFKEDKFFIKFLSDHYDAIVLEDIDFNLKSRKDGNSFMVKLLSGSDGLISGIKRKIILSTNLKNITDIDDALLRKGRCFETVHTRALDIEEADKLANILGKDITAQKAQGRREFTLAEIYNP